MLIFVDYLVLKIPLETSPSLQETMIGDLNSLVSNFLPNEKTTERKKNAFNMVYNMLKTTEDEDSIKLLKMNLCGFVNDPTDFKH